MTWNYLIYYFFFKWWSRDSKQLDDTTSSQQNVFIFVCFFTYDAAWHLRLLFCPLKRIVSAVMLSPSSIHPSSSTHPWLRGLQFEQGRPVSTLPPALLGGPKVSPSEPVFCMCPGSCSGPPTVGTCPEYLPREASRGHLKQMPSPAQLAPLDVEE